MTSAIASTNSLIAGLANVIGTAVNTKQTNKTNLLMTRETNAANRQMVEMQNKAAKEEADLAYKRSSASNQVSLMRGAGMSRAGAINALNGGGSYTPAPVNVSQDQAPQMQTTDLSGLANIAQTFAQRAQQKHDEKMLDKQLQIEREKQNLERDKFEYEKKRTTQNDAYDNIIKTFQAAKLDSEANSANLDFLVKEFTQNERIDAEKQRLLSEKARSLSDQLKNKLMSGALNSVDEETMQALFKYQAMLEMVGNIGHMTLDKAINVIHDIKEIFVPG